jgi:hypothetical protein
MANSSSTLKPVTGVGAVRGDGLLSKNNLNLHRGYKK